MLRFILHRATMCVADAEAFRVMRQRDCIQALEASRQAVDPTPYVEENDLEGGFSVCLPSGSGGIKRIGASWREKNKWTQEEAERVCEWMKDYAAYVLLRAGSLKEPEPGQSWDGKS